MSKGRRHKGPTRDRAPRRAETENAPPRWPLSGRNAWVTLLAATAVVAVALVVFGPLTRPSSGRVDFPPPAPAAPDTGATFADFVGSDECEECHKPEYDAWARSTHGNAGGLPGEVRILAPFDGRPIRFSDALVIPERRADGRLIFRVQQRGRDELVFEVAGVVGGGHMLGGGTQAFFAQYPDGTFRFLPFDFIRQEGVWFCQTAGRADQGWAPISEEMPLAACNDWPPNRVLGSHRRFTNCQQCHGSQIVLTYDAGARRYSTRFTTLAINCESCHGPGNRHIEIADSDSIGRVADIGVEALATLDKDGSLGVCFQCHAVKAELRPGFVSGRRLERYFGDLLLLLSYRPYFPDGRIRLFAYQQQHLYSDCYLNGSMTCVDCHDPHSQTYRDIWGTPLVGRFSDGQCVDCHPSKTEEVAAPAEFDSLWAVPEVTRLRDDSGAPGAAARDRFNAHARHRAGTLGSRCTDCHMPYLQEPDVGETLRYSRSDHTIPVPRPRLDALFGVENACVKCHHDRSLEDVETKLTEWYGRLKPPKALVRGLIEARGANRLQAARLMLLPEREYAAMQFSNLSYFMLEHLGADMPSLEREVVERLQRLAHSEDLDLQALALASLHLARGNDPEVRSFLVDRLRALGPTDRDVRRRWVWILDFRGEAYTARNELEAALKTFQKAAEVLPEDPRVLQSLGNAHANLGNLERAVAMFRRSVAADPESPVALERLALALSSSGRLDEGLAIYRQAIELNPYEPRTYFSLGRALARAGDVDGALEAFQRTIALEPGMSAAHFALATAYRAQDRLGDAIAALERGLEFDPGNPAARQMLSTLRQERAKDSPVAPRR